MILYKSANDISSKIEQQIISIDKAQSISQEVLDNAFNIFEKYI